MFLFVFIYFTIKSGLSSDIYYCSSVIDEFVDSVWREERVLFGVLTDDFVVNFSMFANWTFVIVCKSSMV